MIYLIYKNIPLEPRDFYSEHRKVVGFVYREEVAQGIVDEGGTEDKWTSRRKYTYEKCEHFSNTAEAKEFEAAQNKGNPAPSKEHCKYMHKEAFESSPTFGFTYCPICDWFPYGYSASELGCKR